jgi:excisionase family DNA binding protein
MTARTSRPVPRLALSKREAAEALGVSVDHLERHVLEHVRVVYVGARRLIPVAELERFLADNATAILEKRPGANADVRPSGVT